MSVITVFNTKAPEQGTYIIELALKDETGAPVIPTSASWTLLNNYGAVVNDRAAVALPLSSTATIVLSGNDLNLENGSVRTLTIAGVYDSSAGSGLTLRAEAKFFIEALRGVL